LSLFETKLGRGWRGATTKKRKAHKSWKKKNQYKLLSLIESSLGRLKKEV
jgi:hypothetical protein